MKKSILISLIMLFYLFTTCGVYLSLHYCGGKLKSLSFIPYEKNNGCCCGKKYKSRKGCCKYKTVYIKLKDNQKATEQLKSIIPAERMILFANAFNTNLNLSLTLSEASKEVYLKPPLLFSSNALYLTYRSLLI